MQCVFCVALWLGGGLPALFGVEVGVVASWQLGESLLLLMIVWAVFGSVSGILVRLYAPYGRFALGQWIGTGQRVGQLALLLGVALLGGGFLAYAWGFVIYSVLLAIIWFPALRRAIPVIYPWWKGFSFREAGRNLFDSGWLTAGTVLTNLAGSGVTLLMASSLTATAIPAFSTLRTVANVGFQFALVLLNPLMPDVARLALVREHLRLRQIFSVLLFVAGAPLCVGLALGSPFAAVLFSWWTRGHVEFSAPLYALLVYSVLIRTLSVPFNGYLTALNHVRTLLGVTALQVGVMLVVALSLARPLGTLAFGLGVLTGELVAIVASYLACRRLDPGTFAGGGTFAWRSTLIWPLLIAGLHLIAWCRSGPLLQVVFGLAAAAFYLVNYVYAFRRMPAAFQHRILNLMPRPLRARLMLALSPSS
jgi:O-antigen/teichoic acid export membrane protein